MLLKKLTLENYKTFYGFQEIDFFIPKEAREEEKKNIILVGGLNGAGKTTILKAITYVLFGKRGLKESEYKRLFSNIINNTFFDEGGRNCSVVLVFETDKGEEWTLKVRWYFDNYKRVSHEERELFVKKPGSKFAKHARIDNIEAFNRFIDKIIPYHAAPFFIFDGEEIKEIILRQNSKEMREAILKITGMESYQLLIKDLEALKNSIERKLSTSVSNVTLKRLQNELEKVNENIETLEGKKEGFLNEIRKLENLIQKAKAERSHKISQNSKSRETLIKEQSKHTVKLELLTKELHEFLAEHGISIILREKISKLKKRLKLESDIRHEEILLNSSLTPYRRFINKLLSKNIVPPLTAGQLEQIEELGEEIWISENKIKNSTPADFIELHDISNNDYNYLMSIPITDKHHVSDVINRIEKLQQKLNSIEIEIRNAPEAVDIKDENRRIDVLTKKQGEINLKIKSVNKKLNTQKTDKANILNKLSRTTGKDENLELLQTKHSQVENLIAAMTQFVEDMTTLKASYIREEFAAMLNKLFRKQNEFGKIEFDIQTFTIRLFNDKMQEISIQDRSAGEMQMISSSLIWALTKASDLALPMVIDTPLGRLDSHHRSQLIKYYYKELSEQVIILSTDTEITEEYVKLMQENSYRQFMLDYNEKLKYTTIRDGYFKFIKG